MKDPPKDVEDDEPQPTDEADAAPEPDAETNAEPRSEPEASDDRPDFARAWPRDEELDRLLLAFQRGNYAFVRSEAPRVAKSTATPAVRDAALDLRRRIDPDPLSGFLLLVAIALLITFSGYYLSGAHEHDEPAAPSATPQPIVMPPAAAPRPKGTP